MFKKTVSLLLVFLMITCVFAACSKKDSSNADLLFPIDIEPRSLDPQIADPAADIVTANCFEGLVRIGENGEILPGVAKVREVSGDGLVYTFRLKNDAKWYLIDSFSAMLGKNFKNTFSTAVTARDFVFGMRRAVNPQTASPYASLLFMIKNAQAVNAGTLAPEQLGIEAVDDFTLKITLEYAGTDFLNVLASPVCMPCNEVFFNATKGKYGLGDDFLLCNGPFYLSVWTQGNSFTLRKNKEYKGDTAVLPNSVSLRINPDPAKRVLQLMQGGFSAIPVSEQTVASLDSSGGITLKEYRNITMAICFNCSEKSLSSAAVRIALCMAIEKSTLAPALSEKTKTGMLVPACCKIGQTPFAQAAKNFKPLIYDLAAAKNFWNTGLRELSVKQVTLNLLCPAEYETDMRSLLQTWQKAFGIELSVSIEVVEPAVLQKRVSDGDFQIALAPVQTNKSSAAEFLQKFESSSPDNILKYKSDTYDKIMKQIRTAGSEADTVLLCELAQDNLLQNGAVYPLFSQSSYFALAKGVSGIYTSPAGETVYFIHGKVME